MKIRRILQVLKTFKECKMTKNNLESYSLCLTTGKHSFGGNKGGTRLLKWGNWPVYHIVEWHPFFTATSCVLHPAVPSDEIFRMTFVPELEKLPSGLQWKNIIPLNWKIYHVEAYALWHSGIPYLDLCILCLKKWTQELFHMMLRRPENNYSVYQPGSWTGHWGPAFKTCLGVFSLRVKYCSASAHRLWQGSAVVGKNGW